MKKTFEEPFVEVEVFHVEDVITDSADAENTLPEF